MEKLFTVKELSEILKISESALRAWKTKGVGPKAIKIQNQVRYRESDIERYINER